MDCEGEDEPRQIPRGAAKLIKSFGLEGSRRNNVAYIGPGVIIHACGDIVHFFDLKTRTTTFQASVEGNGIGCVAVHPKKTCYAVCEKGVSPNIYIYSYPSLELYKTLTEGTERYFTAANFNNDGSQMATVGAHPDYLLTVWDWENELMILRTKAFSQEVFKVNFSRYFEGQLITSGVGHVRFWKMAETFTGLKLEGALAKFGTVPISDIAAYFELRNSKVLTGTEMGTILVWDDSLIKCQLKRPGGEIVMCHDGMVEYLHLDEDKRQMISAAHDGYIRFWNLDWLEAANDGDDKLVCEILPTKEVLVDPMCHIKGILCEKDHWIIQDEGGAIWKARLPLFQMEKLLEFHAGPIVGVASSPVNYNMASAGSDGTVRLYDFKEKGEIFKRRFNGPCSMLLWLPLNVDPTGQSVVVGFEDGVIRVLTQTKDHWRLSVAAKPHKLAVTALGCSPDGQLLASVSTDGSVFFFQCSNSFRPLGYTMVPGPITCMDWSPNGLKLLVACSNGVIMEIGCPRSDGDTSKSFELNDLTKTHYSFKRPKVPKKLPLKPPTSPPPLPPPPSVPEEKKGEGTEGENKEGPGAEVHNEGEAPKDGEALKEGETPKADKALKEEVSKGGEDPAAAPPESELLPGLSPEPPTPPRPPEPIELADPPGTTYPIRAVLYSHGHLNTFYVAAEGLAAGFIFECHGDSEDSMGYTEWSMKCLKCVRYTHSKKYLISGADNGVVRIQEAPIPGQLRLAEKSKYWEAGLHDGFYGVVNGATLSFDDQFLASVAKDGSFFIHTIEFVSEKLEPPAAAPQEVPKVDVEDVAANMLSIEEQRAKLEQDEINRLALEKKNKMLAKVAEIRDTLTYLIKRNKEREQNEQLQPQDFEIDPLVRGMLKEETIAEVEQARKELQWDTEKRNVALRKLYGFFLDPLEVEHILLYAFASGSQTSTFRTPKLSPQFQIAAAEAKREGWVGRRVSRRSIRKRKQTEKAQEQPEIPKKKEKIERADEPGISKLEYRRRLLKQRMREWDALLLTKPDMTWVSDEDADAIEWAQTNKGDFKLKSDKEYVVPDELYTNASLKRNEILLFGEAVYEVKMAFNNIFLALREKKKILRETLLRIQSRIIEINKHLAAKDPVIPIPDMQKAETPEAREIVTQEDRDAYVDKLGQVAVALAAAESKAKEGGGLDGMTSGKNKEEMKDETIVQLRFKTPKKAISSRAFKRKVEVVTKIVFSPLEEAEREAKNIRLQFEKSKLVAKMLEIITSFDNELEDLRMEKYQLEINMKCADIKTLALYQEFKVLRILQPTEEALDARHNQKLIVDANIVLKSSEHEKLVDANKEEVQVFVDQRQQLMNQWEAMNPPVELNPAHDVLHQMYTKKMRRPKKKKEGGEDEESDESEMDETADDDEDEYEDEDFVEFCPPKADPELYAKMVALRDKRCELDYLILDQNKVVEGLLREKGTILKKRNAIAQQLTAVENEIKQFQTLKQRSLNNVQISLTLRLSQIEYMDDGKLPEDLSGGLVFSLDELRGLKDRLEAHGLEKVALRKLHKELHREHAILNQERRFQEKKTQDTENKYVEVQLLKFGQTITDETLDIISITKDLVFLRDRLRSQEAGFTHDLTDWLSKTEAATDKLRMLTKGNAAILHIIADIKEKMNAINVDLKHRAGTTYVDPLLEKRKAEADQKILCVVVAKQDEEIRDLQKEIIKVKTVLPNTFPCD